MRFQFETAIVKAEQLRAVYDKAKEDLDAIWPVYLQWAKLKDERFKQEREAKYQDEKAKYDAEVARAKADERARRERYEAKLEQWVIGCRWFRGAMPEPPPPRFSFWLYRTPPMRDLSGWYEETIAAEDVRHEIDSMATLAHSGPEDFHLTQPQLARMVQWSEGKVIGGIKAKMKDVDGWTNAR